MEADEKSKKLRGKNMWKIWFKENLRVTTDKPRDEARIFSHSNIHPEGQICKKKHVKINYVAAFVEEIEQDRV